MHNDRFADVLGLDLAYVKHVMTDEVPNVPKCAYDDLEFDHPEMEAQQDTTGSSLAPQFPHSPMRSSTNLLAPPARPPSHSPSAPALTPGVLVPMFAQPGALPDMHDVLRERQICLERAVSPRAGLVAGTCAVRNLSFEKRVSVRATTDEWATSWDVDCAYVDGSCDGFSDRFRFQVAFAPLPVGRRMQICLRFVAVGAGEFWDSNAGNNYVFQCAAPAASQQSEDPWFNNVHNY